MADRLIMQTRDACSLLGMLLLQGLLCRKGDKSLRGESLSKRQQQWEIPHAITKLKIDHPSSLKIDISRQKKSRRKAWLLRGIVKQKALVKSELDVQEWTDWCGILLLLRLIVASVQRVVSGSSGRTVPARTWSAVRTNTSFCPASLLPSLPVRKGTGLGQPCSNGWLYRVLIREVIGA